MNWLMLKDSKTMSGFVLAMLLSILSVVFAVKGNGYWIVLVVLATVLTFLSINRADKIYKARS
ncbi:hypothetical protein [Bacillus cereus]|uniref:hypothetical protein n=1 Tax=Bacillus cereus TaxID=1396 RepID=UPI00065B7AC0|nr:hypothetical protein [Bacillus cereus]KMP94265.1 hypothetical protein TU67_29085 [Bacillus cereus]MED2869370.1 hypothetical protein [Bacillus thuringiensis]